MTWRVLEGDCRDVLGTLPERSVQTIVTSPPYFGLRDYGTDGQIGLEPTPTEFAEALVDVFREARRVLRDDGTVWLNLGDSYAANRAYQVHDTRGARDHTFTRGASVPGGMKQKDLIGIPWLVAFALRADGWYLRADIVWHKPNPMPESVRDRPTRAHEFIFLLAKNADYFYDADAIREPFADARQGRDGGKRASERNRGGRTDGLTKPSGIDPSANGGRNKRDVWTVNKRPFKGAHFAVFPTDLIEPCVLAGSSPKACGQCGAPWRRVSARRPTGYDGSRYGERAVDATGGAISGGTAASTLGSSNGRLVAERETVGWQSTCEHDDDTGRCVVLDPFSGAGTTGLVAVRHGREYVGVELNPEYAELSRRRIAEDTGPKAKRAREVPPEQLSLEAVA